MKNKKCKFCKSGNSFEKIYEDSVCWIAESNKDNSIAIIVYNSHNIPSQREIQHMWAMTQKMYPEKTWSNKKNKLGHWYEHIYD